MVRLHPHALTRLSERGVTQDEVQERFYATKEIEVIVVRDGEDWLVITVVTRYY